MDLRPVVDFERLVFESSRDEYKNYYLRPNISVVVDIRVQRLTVRLI